MPAKTNTTMFFREKHSNTSKSPVIQLVENYRVGAKVKQRIVVSLGTEVDIPKRLRKSVAQSVENLLLGIQTIWIEPEIRKIAEPIVRQIQSEGKWISLGNVNSQEGSQKQTPEVAEVYVDHVDHAMSRELGPSLIGHEFWQRLGLDSILKSLKFSNDQVRTAEISVINRLVSGDSEHSIVNWLKTSAIGDLLGAEIQRYGKDRFYRISDKLLTYKTSIERALYARERNYFGGSSSLILYDLTNSYFEGISAKNPKAKYNKNQKEKRTDCPQVVIALVLDGDGFCRNHFTFNGKMSDSKSLEIILKNMSGELNQEQKPTVIIDKGIATEDNITLIKNQYKLHYIVAGRSHEEDEFSDIFQTGDFETLKKDRNNEVKVRVEKRGDNQYLLCKSSGRAKKEKAMRNLREEKFEDDLEKLRKRIKNGRINSPEDVNTAIGRIRERHNKVAYYYDIQYKPYRFKYTVTDTKAVSTRVKKMLDTRLQKSLTFKMNYLAMAKDLSKLKQKYTKEFKTIKTAVIEPELQWSAKDEKQQKKLDLEGNYVLKTDRDDFTQNEIWSTYVMLTRVEKAFRNFKTDLTLRPNYHQLEHRVDGHIFISVLAYHLLHAIEYTLRQKNMNVWWSSVKRVMSSHTYSTIIMPTVNGTVIHKRKAGITEEIHKEIYDKLNIDYLNLKTTKMLI